MAEITFYLRDPKVEKTTIYISACYDGNRARFSTELKIPSKNWNNRKNRAKETLDFPEGEEINYELNSIVQIINTIIKRSKEEGININPKALKIEFARNEDSPVVDQSKISFWEYFESFVEYKRAQVLDVRDYHNSLRKHFKAIEQRVKRPLSFGYIQDATSSFLTVWNKYLKHEAINSKGEKGLSMNTVGKQNKNLKVFLNWSFDKGIYAPFSLKAFPTLMEEVDNIYLTEDELVSLVKVQLTESKEQKVRDLFILGCETGLRFIDFTRVTNEHIQEGYLTFSPKKTQSYGNNKIIIPLSDRFQKILDSNNGDVPSIEKMSITEFNKTIRSVCEKAGINKKLNRYREVGGKKVVESYFRYQEVSSHTCRRTFCTLKFLKGMPAQAIMKFSGHRTERNFLKYLKLDAELTARKYGEFF